ncbi:uncharacterized protein E0L32_003958 [Thyridium curvatum]|uniref:Uncharacterized protein n=1 Tax=Thyridium curvatum TaxID=1093900 RepID=A0A507BG73_9PEZI|nr:uncharacterized protein E0L32_003958 [Thyridium curvatum]TPX16309.1 hypothetical protein E0L32_003958 [Thyridium curvatum]
MPSVQEFQLHPLGWETDPEEERFKLSTLDYLTTTTWTSMALFFKVEDSERRKIMSVLKNGLERTLSQTRHLVGTIEKDPDGHHSIVRKKTSTVQFVVQNLAPNEFPSFDTISKSHFLSSALGNVDILCNPPMTCGNKPEAHPDNSPALSSFKANFITGGLIFNIHTHHYSNGILSFNALVQQLAENCYAISKGSEFPSWDPRCLDRNLFGYLGFDRPSNKTLQIEAPPRATDNTQYKPSQSMLFHLPKSRAAELKKAAASSGAWISTYNAMCALVWRTLTKLRMSIYKPDPNFKPLWAEGVSIAKLFTDPPMPARMQSNLQIDITSTMLDMPQWTVSEIVSAPLYKLALYTRQMTDSVTAGMLADRLQKLAHVRNKWDLSINVDSFPPMSQLFTDWRYAKICTYDFGFAEPSAFRHLFGGVSRQALVYPPHKGPAGGDEGMEILVTVEIELMQRLLEDPEWNRYFEFRGIDASEEASFTGQRAKL